MVYNDQRTQYFDSRSDAAQIAQIAQIAGDISRGHVEAFAE